MGSGSNPESGRKQSRQTISPKPKFDKCLINFILSKLKKKENKLNEEIELLKLSHKQCFDAYNNFNNQSEFYYNKIITKHYNKIKFEDDTNKIKLFDKSKPIFIVGLPRSGSTLIESLITQSSNNVNSFGTCSIYVAGVSDK